MTIDYAKINATLYDDVTDPNQVGRFRAWYHTSRFQKLRSALARFYMPGMVVVDVACGNCVWNSGRVPVVGMDINRNMLLHARSRDRLSAGVVLDIEQGEICMADCVADIVVCSEVLEHMQNYPKLLRQFQRILKVGGMLIVTVPYDQPGTPFWALFNCWCLFKGHVLADEYYKSFCGHVNHFSKRTIGGAIAGAGFKMVDQFAHNGFVIYNIATK